MKGWISLSRQITDNWLWNDKPFASGQAWIDLLLSASHDVSKFRLGSQMITLNPGELVTSESRLAERWGWSRTKVRNFLSALEADSMIKQQKDNKKTSISIVNWSKFQLSPTAKKLQTDRSATGERQVRDNSKTHSIINNNVNNKNNEDGGQGITAGRPAEREIVNLWNGIEHTANISTIADGTERFKNLCDCVSLVGAEGITKAILKVRDSEYLKRKGNIKFDNYINPNAILKLLEGFYDEDYEKGGEGGYKFGW